MIKLLDETKRTDVQILKDAAIKTFKQTGFALRKWYSNFSELEDKNPEQSSSEQKHAKQQLGVKTGETKMLEINWNKNKDKLNIEIPPPIQKITKRNILQKLAAI